MWNKHWGQIWAIIPLLFWAMHPEVEDWFSFSQITFLEMLEFFGIFLGFHMFGMNAHYFCAAQNIDLSSIVLHLNLYKYFID